MNTDLSVPAPVSLYIILQRTAYQSWLLAQLLRRGPGSMPASWARLEAVIRRKAIAARYVRGIQRDYQTFLPWLPVDAESILDVGCGLAAIDILLSRHYSRSAAPQLYLADFGDTSPRIDYDFGIRHAHYNSLEAARRLLGDNGVPAETIHFIAPPEIGRADPRPVFDLVISTLAWGFHFPVGVYLEEVSNAMREGARVILDIRQGTSGIEQLRTRMHSIQVVEETEVRQRVVATR